MPLAWRERRWPAEKWLAPAFIAALKHIKFFIPNGEEVGYAHVTSPLLTTYIAKYEPAYDAIDEVWNYGGPNVSWQEGTQQELNQIRRFGGFSIIAHPVQGWDSYKDLQGFRGMEIYSGYVTYKQYEGTDPWYSVDRNADMIANWDRVLGRDDRVIGVGVNDHFGPDNVSVPAKLRDSGKSIVLAHTGDLAGFGDALNRGAVFAVKDISVIKDHYPTVSSIVTTETSITLLSDGYVVWIASGGKEIASGPSMQLGQLEPGTSYVRAIVTDPEANAVYTQAFAIRSVLDTNGDGVINSDDDATCLRVTQGTEHGSDYVAACTARSAYMNRTGQSGD